jgi:uncharacterized CHY-type Zn-finger protein
MGEVPKSLTLITYTQIFVCEFPRNPFNLKMRKHFASLFTLDFRRLTFDEVKE